MRTDRQWETLAGEYVIGTLSTREQKIYDNILRHDIDFRERVVRWQQTFSPLDTMLEPQEPDPRVWDQVAAALNFAASQSAESQANRTLADDPETDSHNPGNANTDTRRISKARSRDPAIRESGNAASDAASRIRTEFRSDSSDSTHDDSQDFTADNDLTGDFDDSNLSGRFEDDSGQFVSAQRPFPRRVRRERRRSGNGLFGFLAGVLLASIGWWQAPVLQQMVSQKSPDTPLPTRNTIPDAFVTDVAAIVSDRDGQPLWILKGSVLAREIHVTALALPALGPGQVFELWLVRSNEFDWVSAGVLALVRGQTNRIPVAELLVDIEQFVVSIEAKGGSTEGRPTSELLFRGNAHSIK